MTTQKQSQREPYWQEVIASLIEKYDLLRIMVSSIKKQVKQISAAK